MFVDGYVGVSLGKSPIFEDRMAYLMVRRRTMLIQNGFLVSWTDIDYVKTGMPRYLGVIQHLWPTELDYHLTVTQDYWPQWKFFAGRPNRQKKYNFKLSGMHIGCFDPKDLCQKSSEDISTKILNCKLTDEEKATLAERGYKMQSVISEGSCSLVYLTHYEGVIVDENAVQRNVSLKLACKVMETEQAPKDFVQKFLMRELNIIAQISHPHIIHTHSILHLNTKVLVFMRNAEYGNLCEYITNYGGLREKQARLWFRQLAVGVEYLHSINIAHRDIKCENILITSSLNVKICDFGFARFCADTKGKAVFSTTFCGSVAYAAPELIKGTPYVPMYSDVWSLGIVLYIMLNAVMPFRTDNLGKLWSVQISKSYRFRTAVIPTLSKEVIYLVSRMLEPNWTLRATIKDVLKSEWFATEPSILDYTPMEAAALQHINIKPNSNIKKIKKIFKSKNSNKHEKIPKESNFCDEGVTCPNIPTN